MPPKNCKEAVLALNAYLLERHEHPTAALPVGSSKSQYLSTNARFCFRHRALRINSDAGWSRAFAAWSDDTNTFFTIGHSTRTIVEFVDLLRESGVDLVIDVRSMPRSRTNPQFNQESLPETLAPWQIGYEHIGELGGLRGKSRGAEALAQYLLASAQLSQLRRLCPDGAIRYRPGAAPGTRRGATVRRSCAPKRSGGAATAGSSPTTFWPQASK